MAHPLGVLFLRCCRYQLWLVCLFFPAWCAAQQTSVRGKVVDAETALPLAQITVSFNNGSRGTSTNNAGIFTLVATGNFTHIAISGIGYKTMSRVIKPGTDNVVQIKMVKSQTELKEVSVSSGPKKAYRNKDNPAVELIRRIISHKDSNRMQSAAYLQYDQYERIGISLFNIPPALVNNWVFRPYSFMLDTVDGKLSAQVFLSEKKYTNYSRLQPEKSIKILQAQQQRNIIKFIDTTGLDIYLNRLYGNDIDIYQNNIFILTNQFLSPIANHSPDFYKFFITDTIHNGKETFVELSFTPRNKGDLLFEGHLLVTLDGRYAVASCELDVNKQVNINFLSKFSVGLEFQKSGGGRYYLSKSDVKADFGVANKKAFGVAGERVVYNSGYLINQPLAPAFYQGKSEQVLADFNNKTDTGYWHRLRPDTLPQQQALFYPRVARLENMQAFKRLTYVSSALSTGYAGIGPFQLNTQNLLLYDYVEGLRVEVGGRSTPRFSNWLYLQGDVAYGKSDRQLKYTAATYFSLNRTPFYRYPNNYFKISAQYDVSVPGATYATGNFQTPLSSFQTGTSRYYLYSHVYKFDYLREFDNHFSIDIGFKNNDRQATSSLVYEMNNLQNTVVNNVTSSEADVTLRYAPHEQIIQGSQYRRIIYNKYPVFTLQVAQGFKGVLNGSFNFTNFTATINKRLYLSQLGFADVTLQGNMLMGKVPFPLLNIAPANQSVAYDANAYNDMNYLEFVSDHYAGVNFTQSFNGFFLNKVPLIKHLKWREFLSFKALYGGLRNENNPLLSPGLYDLPSPSGNVSGTYALGNTPYVEAGVGIGNIFKLLRIDAIRRFNYLDHPNASAYGVKFSVSFDF